MKPGYEIRLDEHGGRDEIVATNATVQLEAMDRQDTHTGWFLGITVGKTTLRLNFFAAHAPGDRDGGIHVEVDG
jgi:hypothetical protein